jgi:hypothetical protein
MSLIFMILGFSAGCAYLAAPPQFTYLRAAMLLAAMGFFAMGVLCFVVTGFLPRPPRKELELE